MSAVSPIVTEVTAISPRLAEAFRALVPQLSKSSRLPSAEELQEIASGSATTLLIAVDPETNAIIGTLSLVIFRIPTGVRAWIEDVVVDQSARQRGVGRALVDEAIRRASLAGARTLDLTSRPERSNAHSLYTSAGFAVRETSVYRHAPDSGS